jgi:hypothetical protein
MNQKTILLLWSLRLRASAKNSQITSNIALLPYGAIDCELQYKIIERYLIRNTDIKFTINYVKPIKFPRGLKVNDDTVLLSYEEKLERLCKIVGASNFDIIRGVIDEYRSKCTIEELFEKSTINSNLIHELLLKIEIAKKITDENMIFILPDIAYTKSRSIKHFAKIQEKKVIIINPYGEVRDISNYKPLDPDPSEEEILSLKNRLDDDFDIENAAFDYVRKRINGEIVHDIDAQRAFITGEPETSLKFADKKILFLHCIADSANVPVEITLSDGIVLNDYFLWTKDMLEIISRDPNQWLIKIHPASKLYPKDISLIERLMKMYEIPNEVIIPDGISTLQVLISKAPIFTHSGTIALESAALGQRSVCVKGRFADEIAYNVTTMNEIKKLAIQKTTALQELLKNDSEESMLAASWLFLWRANFDFGKIISIKHPIQPNMSSREYLITSNRICIEFYKKILSKNFHSRLSELVLPLVSNKYPKA